MNRDRGESPEANGSEPRRLGDFELLREVGRGGMGIVYEARQVSLNRKVALKVLGGGFGLARQAVQRFRREAEAAAKLHHTNIVPIYATGEQDGTHFYAMELVEGPSLDQVIRQARTEGQVSATSVLTQGGPVLASTQAYAPAAPSKSEPTNWSTSSSHTSGIAYFDTAAKLIADVADALEYAHRQKIVHRDIKPSNLLVSPDGRLSLNDFGLARVLEEPGMTATGEMLGTPAYMSPEQITAGRTPLDHRTDIYSLGATLYELLTLQPPYSGERRDQLLAQILHKDPTPLRRINKKIPVDLETICLKAMDRDPDRRYQSAGQLADDLKRYVNRFAIVAKRAGPFAKLVKRVQRHPSVTAGVVFAVVAILCATWFGSQAYQVEQRRVIERQQAQQHLKQVERDHALEEALVAATSGDLEKADKAINKAESLGATPTQVAVLRGQVAYFIGDFQKALAELEQAVAQSPKNIAARGLLALTFLHMGNSFRHKQEMEQLDALVPQRSEDYLFKAYAICWYRPDESMMLLNDAMSRFKSVLAIAIRADVKVALAERDNSLVIAREALDEIAAIKKLLPDNALVVSISLNARMMLHKLLLESGDTSSANNLLSDAIAEADFLEKWKNLPYPSFTLWTYYGIVNDQESLLRLASENAKQTLVPVYTVRLALLKWRGNQIASAIDLLEKRSIIEPDGDFAHIALLAEEGPRGVEKAFESLADFKAKYVHQSAIDNAYNELDQCRLMLIYLGKGDEALAAYRDALPRLDPNIDELEPPLFRYGAGDISADELTSISKDRWFQFRACFHIGLNHLADGNRVDALRFFRRAQDTGIYGYFRWEFAESIVARMEQDPNWPPWIPVKE